MDRSLLSRQAIQSTSPTRGLSNIRLKYHVGRGYYIPNMSELADDEFASDFEKGNADTLILYAHP
jgi:hypothetical protein